MGAKPENKAKMKAPIWKHKICPVVNYSAEHGIVGFTFDGVPCQSKVGAKKPIGSTIEVKYIGTIGKDFKFTI